MAVPMAKRRMPTVRRERSQWFSGKGGQAWPVLLPRGAAFYPATVASPSAGGNDSRATCGRSDGVELDHRAVDAEHPAGQHMVVLPSYPASPGSRSIGRWRAALGYGLGELRGVLRRAAG